VAGRRVMVEGIDQDFPRPGAEPDLSMPTMEDARVTLASYQRFKHVLPLPNERMMIHVGARTVENFFVVADAWAQVLNRYIQPDSHVMDIGCGCGRTARMLAGNPYVRRFTGIDVVVPYVAYPTLNGAISISTRFTRADFTFSIWMYGLSATTPTAH
jgi:hypothetical protein